MRTLRPAAVGLAGLEPPAQSTTPAARRRWLAGLSRAEIGGRLVALAQRLRESGPERHAPLAAAVGLPLAEVLASPFAVRAVALAAEVGACVHDHELRAATPWPSDWRAADSVADESHATWQRGVLEVGKYQSFLQDEPLSSFNPNHMSKWGPHELLHRASRFFYRADMTRWELYLGARLNELVPVVFWYGPDEVLRLDREGFDRARDARDPEARIESARWLFQDDAELSARAEASSDHLHAGLAHVERELDAIDREISTARQVRLPHAFLDASTDAIAYVMGHWTRLTAPSTAGLMGGLLREGRDYLASVRAYRERVEGLVDRLLFGEVSFDADRSAARRSGRQLWDVLGRAAQCGERAWRKVEPLLPEARAALDSAWDGVPVDLPPWLERIAAALGSRLAGVVLAVGDPARSGAADFGLLAEGIESAAPASLAAAPESAVQVAERLARGPHLRRRRHLADRLEADFAEAGATPERRALLAFERALLLARSRSDQIERLAHSADDLPPGWERGFIAANEGFALLTLAADAAAAHAAWAETGVVSWPEPGPATYLLGAYLDGISVLPAPAALAAAWKALQAKPLPAHELLDGLAEVPSDRPDWPQDAGAWLEELMRAGAVGWVPAL